MATFLETIIEEKKHEVAGMPLEEIQQLRVAPSFEATLRDNSDTIQLIAEIKRASPSKGDINLDVDILVQAKSYEDAGVAAISVLTDPYFFKGSIEDLRAITKQVNLPVLCKDFIIDEKQLIRARNSGATIVLLIVAALSRDDLESLFEKAQELGLEVLMEVHNEEELQIAEEVGATLIGVNNRNLHTFEVDINVSEELAKLQQRSDALYISESGFYEASDVARIKDNYRAVLVGEALMRHDSPKVAAESLMITR